MNRESECGLLTLPRESADFAFWNQTCTFVIKFQK